MTLFDEIMESKHYKKLLEQLPEDERVVILDSLRKFVEEFENSVLVPLKNLDSK